MRPRQTLLTLSALLLSSLAGFSPARGDPRSDFFTALCNSVFDGIVKDATREKAPGPKSFIRGFADLVSKNSGSGTAAAPPGYLDRVFDEWLLLPDPVHHLAVLQFPVPEGALETLDLAARNQMDAASLEKLLKKRKYRGIPKTWIEWTLRILDQPKFRDPETLKTWVTAYRNSVVLEKNQIRHFTGIPVIPAPKGDHVRMYKGTNFHQGPAISKSQTGKPAGKILSGEEHFMSQAEANTHSVRAEAFHPDGVSVSLDKTVILNYGSHVRIYDIPQTVFEKLPRGAPGLSEYVFRYSIPEKYRVMTIPKTSYVEALRQVGVRNSPVYFKSIPAVSDDSGAALIDFLKTETGEMTIKGEKVSPREIFRNPDHEKRILEGFRRSATGAAPSPWLRIEAPPNVDLRKLAKLTHAFRGSGSLLEPKFRGKLTPHQIRSEVLQGTMERIGCTRAEIELGKTLSENRVLDEVLSGEITPQVGFERWVELSKDVNVSGRDLFELEAWLRSASPEGLPAADDKVALIRYLFENSLPN